jgi:hypothetical protein
MALLNIGEAALAQHAIHDARHRVQVVNDQHRIDIVDHDQPSPSGRTARDREQQSPTRADKSGEPARCL